MLRFPSGKVVVAHYGRKLEIYCPSLYGAFKYRFLIRGMDMIRDIRLIGLINGPSCQSPSTLHYSLPLNPVNVLVSIFPSPLLFPSFFPSKNSCK